MSCLIVDPIFYKVYLTRFPHSLFLYFSTSQSSYIVHFFVILQLKKLTSPKRRDQRKIQCLPKTGAKRLDDHVNGQL